MLRRLFKPTKSVAQELTFPRNNMPQSSFMNLEVDEFANQLRAAGASEHLIEVEIAQFKILKEQQNSGVSQVKDKRRKRAVPEALDPYVEAEIRRTGSVAADSILDELRRGE